MSRWEQKWSVRRALRIPRARTTPTYSDWKEGRAATRRPIQGIDDEGDRPYELPDRPPPGWAEP